MLDLLIQRIKEDNVNGEALLGLFQERTIKAKTILLSEGQTSRHIYFVKKGCLRLWFNNQGKDVSFQFFLEGQAVSSFFGREPSLFTLESIEPSVIVLLKKSDFDKMLNIIPELKDGFYEILFRRFENYAKLFLSQIKDSPEKRYLDLMATNPELIQRIPQHYLASYLGITPVSLSRIRNRKR